MKLVLHSALALPPLVALLTGSVAAQSVVIEWSAAGLSPVPEAIYACAEGVLDNRLHLAAGSQGGSGTAGGNSHYAYDAVTNTWAALDSFPGGAGICGGVNTNAIGPASGVAGGKFWVLGGLDSCNSINAGRDAVSYDPVGDCWSPFCLPNMCIPTPGTGYASASLGDLVHVLGAISSGTVPASYESLATSANPGHCAINGTSGGFYCPEFLPGGTCFDPPGLPRAFGAATTLDNRIWYLGGQFDPCAPFGSSGRSIFHSPCNAPISTGGGGCAPTMCDALCAFFMCGAFDCMFCVQCLMGGGGAGPCALPDDACTDRVDAFDPVTSTWTAMPPMPGPLAGHTAMTYDNKIYVFGGVDSCLNFNLDVFVYSPVCNQWAVIPTTDSGGIVHMSSGVLDDGASELLVRAGGLEFPGGMVGTEFPRDALEQLTYTAATAANVPDCTIDNPAPGSTVCNCVDVEYTVSDGDTPTLCAVWKWSTDDGITWNLCTPKGASANPVNVSPGSDLFEWDVDADLGMGPQPVLLAMCVTDNTCGLTGSEFAEDRVELVVDCTVTVCCDLPGDCDESRSVNILDAYAALRESAGLGSLTPTGFANCNVYQSGIASVTPLDALTIARYVVGLEPRLDCCP